MIQKKKNLKMITTKIKIQIYLQVKKKLMKKMNIYSKEKKQN